MAAANQPVLRATDGQPVEPTLGLLLPIIHPWVYELQFWDSPVFLSATKETDCLNLFSRVCENWLFLYRSLADIPREVVAMMRRQGQKSYTLAWMHVVGKLLAPGMYAHCRWALVGHLRLFSLLSTLAMYQHIRQLFVTGTHVEYVDKILLYQVVQGNVAFRTARALFIGTGCVFPFLSALPPVIPFVSELLLQLVYLYYSIEFLAPLTGDVFTGPKHTAGTQQLCDALSSSLPTLHTFIPGAPAPCICGIQRAWFLALWFQLFLGFFFPLYICYTCERRLKLRFLRQLRGTPTSPQLRAPPIAPRPAPPPLFTPIATLLRHMHAALTSALNSAAQQPEPMGRAASSPSSARRLLRLLRTCLLHAAAVYLLAALSWQLAVALQAPLARRAYTIPFHDGYQEWYWELLCGSDQPCCRA